MLPVHVAARVLRALVERAQIDPELIEDVVFGCVTPLGEQGANITRLAVLQAGWPVGLPAVTLNRMCGSGQQAVHFAAQAIAAGDMDVVIAGGLEVMSRVPLATDWPAQWPPDFPYPLVHQGFSAEMVADDGVSPVTILIILRLRVTSKRRRRPGAATSRKRSSRSMCRSPTDRLFRSTTMRAFALSRIWKR
jgi:hypothetical protein